MTVKAKTCSVQSELFTHNAINEATLCFYSTKAVFQIVYYTLLSDRAHHTRHVEAVIVYGDGQTLVRTEKRLPVNLSMYTAKLNSINSPLAILSFPILCWPRASGTQ